jgi:hypothetical protein
MLDRREKDDRQVWFKRLYWSAIYDQKSAKGAKQLGVGAAVFVAGETALLAILAYFKVTALVSVNSFVDASIFALIALGIHRAWRSASVGGLAFYLMER